MGCGIHELFTAPGISVEDQTNLIDDLSRTQVPLGDDLYKPRVGRAHGFRPPICATFGNQKLVHEGRAIAWDNRIPRVPSLLEEKGEAGWWFEAGEHRCSL